MKYELINANVEDKDIVSLVFENRGIPQEKIYDYIECDKDFRTDPLLYVNMEKALDKVHNNMHRNLKTGILVDCDCDGYCSSTIFYKIVKKLYKDADLVFLLHEDKKHGVSDDIEKQIEALGIEFLVVLDAGSNQVEELIEIKKKGIDVLVIDHHEAQYTDEILIVNNQYNDINKGLSGGAMVLKFAEAFLGKVQAEEFMDLAAVSILSDNMPMNNLENRYYVKYGLRKPKNKFMLSNIEDQNEATVKEVSFTIAPIINSIVRVGSIRDKEVLIKAMADIEGEIELPTRKNGKKTALYDYIEAAIKISKWCRSDQKDIVEEEVAKFEIEHEEPLNISILDENFNRNITGYYANVLSGKNLKPTLAIKLNEEKNLYEGSARSSSVANFKDFLLSMGMFEYCEGHQGAFGVGIKKDMLEEFKEAIRNKELPREKIYKVDKIYEQGELESGEIRAISCLDSVWGKDIEKPKFAIRINDACPSFIGQSGTTFKIGKRNINFIKFGCTEEEIRRMNELKQFDLVVIGEMEVNLYKGNAYPQIKIQDMEILEKNSKLEINSIIESFGEDDDFELSELF